MQPEAPPQDPQLGDGIIVRAILEGMGQALVEYWYVWLAMTALLITAKIITDWSKRVEARAKARRRG